MKTTIAFASAVLAALITFPTIAQAHDNGYSGSIQQRDGYYQTQPKLTNVNNARPAFENQQRVLQNSQTEAEFDQGEDYRYRVKNNRNYNYQYQGEYRDYRSDRQEGRNRRRQQRRYRYNQQSQSHNCR
jgi:hypothetical protein